jgi:hypothetical protein
MLLLRPVQQESMEAHSQTLPYNQPQFFFKNTVTHILSLWAPLKDWIGFDFEIHEVDYQERLAVDGDVASHWKNN